MSHFTKKFHIGKCVGVDASSSAHSLTSEGRAPPSRRRERVIFTDEHAQDRPSAPIVASYPYYYSRPEHPVPAIGTFFPDCPKCGGTVPAQAARLLPGTPNSPSQAHRCRTFFFGFVVP